MINVCSHRGACLTKKEKGNSNRFTCPYHGWNFSNSGELIAISSEDDFGKIDKNNYGLKSLPVYESAGLIWAIINPESKVESKTVYVNEEFSLMLLGKSSKLSFAFR